MKKFLFLLIAAFCLNLGWAQDTADSVSESDMVEEEKKEFSGPNDSTIITKKSFDNDQLQKLKSDPNLNYKQAPTVAESLWDRLMNWLGQFIDSLFRNATTTNFGRLFMYVLAVILIIVIIMMLLKVDALKVFYSGADKGKMNYSVFHENIHEMDFEKLIREATDKGEYRLGVRLIFLYALKTLADKQLIDFQAGKTNHDYVEELSAKELKTGLNELSFYFDYAWYGGFSIDKTTFTKVDGIFKSWKGKVS
ncbi:MAG TPA: DUF4129 domain-containing protein [Cyclobacteriaceae bacterium]